MEGITSKKGFVELTKNEQMSVNGGADPITVAIAIIAFGCTLSRTVYNIFYDMGRNAAKRDILAAQE